METRCRTQDRPPWFWPCFLLLITTIVSPGRGIAATREPPPGASSARLQSLTEFEEHQRAQTDWSSRTRANFGADPFRILPAPIENHWIGILRGGDAVVMLDDKARTRAHAAAPIHPTGATYASTGELLVVGESSP